MAQRFNSKGKLIESRHSVERIGPSKFRCTGCGREFGSFDENAYRPYSLANESARLDAHTMARAYRHADACKAPTREELAR